MREEMRLGNAALAQNDIETAQQHFQHLLDHGGTPLQEQIAGNRLREIQAKQDALRPPPPPAQPPKRRTAAAGAGVSIQEPLDIPARYARRPR